MIRNKENSYHRSPTKRYEPTYARRKEQEGYNNNYDNRYEHDSQVPVAPTDYTQSSSPGRTVAVPLSKFNDSFCFYSIALVSFQTVKSIVWVIKFL